MSVTPLRVEAAATTADSVAVEVPFALSGRVDRLNSALRCRSNWRQLFKFGIVGGSGYLINITTFALLLAMGAYYLVGAVGAFLAAVSSNYALNRVWTFNAAGRPVARQASRYFVVSLAGLVVSASVLSALVGAGLAPVLGQTVAVMMVMPLTFTTNKLWTFAAR